MPDQQANTRRDAITTEHWLYWASDLDETGELMELADVLAEQDEAEEGGEVG